MLMGSDSTAHVHGPSFPSRGFARSSRSSSVQEVLLVLLAIASMMAHHERTCSGTKKPVARYTFILASRPHRRYHLVAKLHPLCSSRGIVKFLQFSSLGQHLRHEGVSAAWRADCQP